MLTNSAKAVKLKEGLHSATPYNHTDIPDFGGLKVFVLPGAFYGSCCALMAEAGCIKADSIADADIVVFVGGEDVNPILYNEKPVNSTYFTPSRDREEVIAYKEAVARRKVMFGICRGAQFLHVMNGGKLWQDVDGHAGRPHQMLDVETDTFLTVTSLHHQMLRDNPRLNIVGISVEQRTTRFEAENEVVHVGENSVQPGLEIEAGYYTDSRCFFVQGHPEIGTPQYRSWTMNKLFDFYEEAVMGDEGPDPDTTPTVIGLLTHQPSALETEVLGQIG